MTVEMLAPLRRRNNSYMINPNENGYRPNMGIPVKHSIVNHNNKVEEGTLSPSALITSPDYDKVSEISHALREVKPYSKMLLPEVASEEPKTERTIIYQSMDSVSV